MILLTIFRPLATAQKAFVHFWPWTQSAARSFRTNQSWHAPQMATDHAHLRCSRWAWIVPLALTLCTLGNQATAAPQTKTTQSATTSNTAADNSALEAELVYMVLLGEMQIQAGHPGAGYSLILEAARKSDHPELYRRAVNIAVQSRSGDAALAATKAWASAHKRSPEPLRIALQIMLNLNQIEGSQHQLDQLLDITPEAERSSLLDAIGQTYARTSDHSAALRVATQSLLKWQHPPSTAGSAWAALSRIQLAAGLTKQARESLENSLNATPSTPAPGLLAVEWLNTAVEPIAHERLQRYLDAHPNLHTVRLAYARHLLGASQWAESEKQLLTLSTHQPQLAESWLMLGALQLQSQRLADAQASLKRYLDLSSSLEPEQRERGDTQAYLSLAQIAEQQKQFEEARQWLDRIGVTEDLLRIQLRRASLLNREGKLQEAIELIRATPEQKATDARAKLLAEAQLLKDAKQTAAAFKLLNQAIEQAPDDADVLYEQAMLAEKLGRFAEMERSLRRVIEIEPNNAHAHNALGYSLADRNERLPQAKELIEKALGLLPNDPFILDSLGWVEFRLGNTAEAVRLLRNAMQLRADAEIAAHLGEVLWFIGEREEALRILRQAHTLQPDSETLQSTLQRLGIRL